MKDRDLSKACVADGSQAAFAELVQRHVGLVYSVARRRMQDAHLAEDVTQAVFALLARKGIDHQDEAALARWLFVTARNLSANTMTMLMRRKHHERQAALLRPEAVEGEASWEEVRPLLDEAVASLRKRDQQAVLLRFYEGKSLEETGRALGISAEAARKCATRTVAPVGAAYTRDCGWLHAAVVGWAAAFFTGFQSSTQGYRASFQQTVLRTFEKRSWAGGR